MERIGVCLLPLLAFLAAGVCGLDVSFENRDAGYFLKPSPPWSEENELDRRVDRFTVLHPTQINMVKVAYGPFTAKQTVPAMALLHSNQSGVHDATLLDVSAHVVTKEVRRDQPLLRVLFHLGIGGRDAKMKLGPHTVCITLIAERESERLTTTCIPTPRDGTCLAEITIPAHWWPPLDQVQGVKLRNMVHLEYALTEGECSSLFPSIPSQPTTRLEDIPLSNVHGQYLELKQDEVVRVLVPQGLVYPRSRVYVPVYMYPNPAYPVYVFVLRARVRNGLRILGAQASQPDKWTITMDTNAKQTVATVTAFVKDANTASPESLPQGSQEVFSWLFEIEENASSYDSGRIVWNLRYVLDSSMAEQYNFDDNNIKMTSQLDIQKDDIQAVLPIAKTWELMNTAVLNGKQVSHSMKVYIVSQAGKVADVTILSSCQSVDESILKVSSSCTSVYLDGSEIRGSHNASVVVTYESYVGKAQFTVWIPELPLDIQLPDNKLSLIKGWKIPSSVRSKLKRVALGDGSSSNRPNPFRTNSPVPLEDDDEDEKTCNLRFQQTPVEVYARFFAVDDNSGRESYLLNRKSSFCITELVEGSLRIADARIATLKGRIVQGQSVGRTEVQVLSPITGRVIGAREVRVGNDRVIVDDLKVTVVTGLQLSIQRDEDLATSYVAQTAISHKLTAQYQEGLLDIRLHFSDDTTISLAHVSEFDYHLEAETFDNSVVAFAPKVAQHHPRIIAIGQGKGDLLHVTLDLAETCQRRRSAPLASSKAYIDIDFYNTKRAEGLQNDGHRGGDKASDLTVKFNGRSRNEKKRLLVADDMARYKGNKGLKHHEPTVQARQNLNPVHRPLGLTPLEIGMCALLGVFCIAIVMFVISCAVYAVRYRRKQLPPGAGCESVTNARDWVWLGRAALERGAVSNSRSSHGATNGGGSAASSDMNGNQSGQQLQRREANKVSRPNSNRSSNLSFQSSDVSIRITSNPQLDETAMMPCAPPPPPTDGHPPPSDASPSVESDVSPPIPERRVRIQSNPMPAARSDEELQPMDGSATFTVKKPPIPPHATTRGTTTDDTLPPPPPVKNRAGRGGALPPANALQRSDKAVGPTMSDAEWESVTMGMNYDQLMEYFDNLKESNA